MEKWYTTNNYRELCIAILQENLVALRSKAKLSQDRMANLVGVSRQTYYGLKQESTRCPGRSALLLSSISIK